MRSRHSFLTLLVGLVLVFGVAVQAHAAQPAVVGTWTSEGCEPRPNDQFVQRTFTLAAEDWALDQPIFADAGCSTKLLNFHVAGTYTIGEPNATLADTYDALFMINSIALTPLVDDMAAFLNSAQPGTCGAAAWQVGVEQDISATKGCSVFGIDLSQPIPEYDILKRDGQRLYFGARPADGGFLNTPERRPTSYAEPLLLQSAAPVAQLPSTAAASSAAQSTALLLALAAIALVSGVLVLRRMAQPQR